VSCSACLVVRQLAYNALVTLDLVGNFCLLGQPRETISKRTARARAAGSRAAAAFCAILTWCGKRLGQDRDHCDWALSDTPSIAQEIWHWSLPDTSDAGNG